MKKGLILIAALAATILSVSAVPAATVVTVGASPTPHAEILREAQKLLAPKGVTLKIVEYADYVQPNMALDTKDLDANFFQHKPYLDDFNREKGTKLASLGAVHYEPFGIYTARKITLDTLPQGAQIAVPNDATNEGRALLLLQDLGLIRLRPDAGLAATALDIVENPKKLRIREIEAAQLVRSLPDVDAAIVNGNYALLGGLKMRDALKLEDAGSLAATTYANIVAVRAGEENRPELRALIEALRSPEARKHMEDTWAGAVVPAK